MIPRTFSLLGSLVLLTACSSSPGIQLDKKALSAGLEILDVRGDAFHHRIYRRAGHGVSAPLHVYLEGDGRPWETPTQVARDPHPRNALAFELMRRDPAPALYLGRPCYRRLAAADPCHPRFWTDGRYSDPVVTSMAAALRRTVEPGRPLVLIGYSGGGVLAVLLAERLESVGAVVTVASNLDLAAWVAHHGYTPLMSSLDPATREPLRASIKQLHVMGGRDVNVPPALNMGFFRRQIGEQTKVFPDLDHACCWLDVWPEILRQLDI